MEKKAAPRRKHQPADDEKAIREEAERHSQYLDGHHKHIEILKSECASYDKAILQLSAAAIGISIVFLDKIAKKPAVDIFWLQEAWASLIMSLTIIVFSFLASHQKLRRELEDMKREYTREDPLKESRWQVRPRFLNLISGILLVLGFVCLAFFASANLE